MQGAVAACVAGRACAGRSDIPRARSRKIIMLRDTASTLTLYYRKHRRHWTYIFGMTGVTWGGFAPRRSGARAGPTLLWGKRGVNPGGEKVAIREIHNKHVL